MENPISEDTDYEMILELIYYICNNKDDGAILVFLSGWDQISKMTKILKDKGFGNACKIYYIFILFYICLHKLFFCFVARYILIPLHSMLPTVSQKSVFESPPRGKLLII